MTEYKANKRYVETLEFVEEELNSSEVVVTIKSETGVLFTWETCKRSKPYKMLKESRKGKFSFTYKEEAHCERAISHLKAI